MAKLIKCGHCGKLVTEDGFRSIISGKIHECPDSLWLWSEFDEPKNAIACYVGFDQAGEAVEEFAGKRWGLWDYPEQVTVYVRNAYLCMQSEVRQYDVTVDLVPHFSVTQVA